MSEKARIGVRLTERESQAFRVALAINNDTAQDVLYKAVIDYIKKTQAPDNILDV